MLMFREKVPADWLPKVKANLPAVLVDHAHLARLSGFEHLKNANGCKSTDTFARSSLQSRWGPKVLDG